MFLVLPGVPIYVGRRSDLQEFKDASCENTVRTAKVPIFQDARFILNFLEFSRNSVFYFPLKKEKKVTVKL